MTKDQIIAKYIGNPTDSLRKDVEEAMDEWARQQMITLLTNIAANPVAVYSQKVRGRDKQYFLGKMFIEELIKRIK